MTDEQPKGIYLKECEKCGMPAVQYFGKPTTKCVLCSVEEIDIHIEDCVKEKSEK
jgi:hypothetical protein